MKKIGLMLAVLALCGPAVAGKDVAGNCGNGSGSGNACLTTGGQGGQGGQGGKGGKGGSAASAAQASNKTVVQTRADARSNAVSASISRAEGGSATAAGGSATSTATGGAGGSATASGNGGAGGSASGGSVGAVAPVQSVNFEGRRQAANSAIAGNVQPVWTFSGGKNVGIMGLGGGISIGDSTPSDVCETVYIADAAHGQGDYATAREVLCGLEKYRTARKRSSQPCWQDLPENQGPEGSKCRWMTDEAVRRREGCN